MKPSTAALQADPRQDLGTKDLELVLALVRAGTLAEAGQRLGLDTSSIYRSLKRLEQRLGRSLFDRSRQGLTPTELASQLAERAQAIEAELDGARELLHGDGALTGTLRITSTDIALTGLLLPLLPAFRAQHPQLQLELLASGQLARLERREADVALRGTNRPPEHLVGARLGTIRSALWASERYLATLPEPARTDPGAMAWATPDADETLGDYPSRRWRRRNWPDLHEAVRCDGLLQVAQAVEAGVAVGVAPYFTMAGRSGLVDLSGHLPDVDIDLWLLTHPDVRHLRRVKAFFEFVREHLRLP